MGWGKLYWLFLRLAVFACLVSEVLDWGVGCQLCLSRERGASERCGRRTALAAAMGWEEGGAEREEAAGYGEARRRQQTITCQVLMFRFVLDGRDRWVWRRASCDLVL